MADPRRTILFALALAAALALAGCGVLEGGTPQHPDPETPGDGAATHRTSIGMTTTSTPRLGASSASTAATGATNLVVVYDRVDLVRADGGGIVTVSHEADSVDLMTLHGGDLALLGEVDIPHGTYDQVRLRVVEASISFDGGATSSPVKVPSGSTSGLKIDVHPYLEASAHGVSVLVVDFNAGRSIVETPPGSGNFLLKPTAVRAVSAHGEIGGTVVDAENGHPIEAATVEVRTADGEALVTGTSSDADGAFRIAYLSAGHYEVRAFADGYETAVVADVTVQVDGLTDLGAIALARIAQPEGAELFGSTLDIEAFAPIAGATVEARPAGETEVVASAQTGPLGRFTLEGLPGGTLDLTFSAAGYRSLTVLGVVAAVGARVDVGDVLLTPDAATEPGAVVGTVLDIDTLAAIDGALVEVHVHGEAALAANAFTDADGSFGVEGLAAGTYDLAFSADGYEPHLLTEVTVDAGGVTDVGEVHLSPLRGDADPSDGWIIGLVADIETLAVLPGASIDVFVHGEAAVVATASSGPMGRFLVGDLGPGTYDLVIRRDGYRTFTMSNVFVPDGAIRSVGDALLTPTGGGAD